MMKLVVVLLMAISLAACSGGGDNNTANTTTDNTSNNNNTAQTAQNFVAITADNVGGLSEVGTVQVGEAGETANAVAFSPDSTVVAVAHGNNVTVVTLSDNNFRILRGHEDDVDAIAFSPDGTRLATASADKTVRVWDLSNGQAVLTITAPNDRPVNTVVFSPDGSTIAASASVQIHLISAETGDVTASLDILGNTTTGDLMFTPDGASLISASADGRVRVWDVATGTESSQISLAGFPAAASLSSDGTRLLVSNGVMGGLTIYDVSTGEQVVTVAPQYIHPGVAYSPDATIFVGFWNFGGAKLAVYNATTAEKIGTEISLPTGSIDAIAFSPDGLAVATVGSRMGNVTLSIWRVNG